MHVLLSTGGVDLLYLTLYLNASPNENCWLLISRLEAVIMISRVTILLRLPIPALIQYTRGDHCNNIGQNYGKFDLYKKLINIP